jgi:hypothetical protein
MSDPSTPAAVLPPASPKSRTTTLLLGLLTGVFGGHRFYAGKIASGVFQAVTLGGLGLWWLGDVIVIATGEFTDQQGRRIVHWSPESEPSLARAAADSRLGEDVEQLRGEVYDLQERVDFLERTLAQVRERPGLGPGSRS